MNQQDRPFKSLVARVLWRVETELRTGPSLEDFSRAEGISPFHLSRAFTLVTGQSLIAYVRARRLTEAMRQLRSSDCAVVDVALDCGYESHEGFARAFRKHFDVTPSQARAMSVPIPNMQEPIVMTDATLPDITARFETFPGLRLAGVDCSYVFSERARIPQQWKSAVPELTPAIFQGETFGANHSFRDDGFNYLVGYADDGRCDTEGLAKLELPAGRYAVFDHKGHIGEISETWEAIFSTWAPNSGLQFKDGPEFERYSTEFDLNKPGGVSIWIPIEGA